MFFISVFNDQEAFKENDAVRNLGGVTKETLFQNSNSPGHLEHGETVNGFLVTERHKETI